MLLPMQLYTARPLGSGFRTDCDTFIRIYGVKWQTAWRLKSCRLFNYLVNQYAAAKSYNPQTFGSTEFFKLWCGMGISFDEKTLVRTNAWFQRATSNNRKPVPWRGLGPALDKIYNHGSIPQYPDGVARKNESKDMLIHEIQKNAKFYAKMQSLLQQVGFAVRGLLLGEDEISAYWTPSRDWKSWSPPSESPDWSLTVETLARLYFSEEGGSKREQRNSDSLPLAEPDQLHPVIGGLLNQEIPRPEFPINDQCYSEGESRADSRDEPSCQLAVKDSNAIELRSKLDLGPSDNDSITRGEARGPSVGATTNSRGGDNRRGGEEYLVPALYKSENSDLYNHSGGSSQAVAADSDRGDCITQFEASDDGWAVGPYSRWC
ncbi:hypothetical protein EAF04_001327 [Stromatinia cepivora]|nr:hypothetical protein EAF04_001327 [Stromatinia cepivora]